MNHEVLVMLQGGLVLIFLAATAAAVFFLGMKRYQDRELEFGAARARKHYEVRSELEDKDRERRLAIEGGQSRPVSHSDKTLKQSSQIIGDVTGVQDNPYR